ncbi:hypothetical protein DAI22_06g102300 [Oryza sativa Japonica Group]|nr:uncharacterized protein LOC112939407 [Oryza sativa Japonica Group]KAF2926108.1 hypothetical protein DAI22_06g102300 [Oryza sativa Japonica Group]
MEAVASPPLLASFFLSPPHPTSAVAAACCSRRNTSCAHPPSPGGLEAAVAEVKAAPDPVPALISLQWFPCSIRRGGPPAIDYIDRRCFLQSISNVSSISMDRVIEASRGRQATNANAMLSRVDLLCEEHPSSRSALQERPTHLHQAVLRHLTLCIASADFPMWGDEPAR